MDCFVVNASSDFFFNPDEDIIASLFKQYEQVIVESLVTSFGLDLLINDVHGGNVDTIHNVRQIGKDEQMTYKNKTNQNNYENRGDYKPSEYHKGTNYQTMKSDAKKNYQESGKTVKDAYTGDELYFLGKRKGADPSFNAELDHVMSAKSIHEDRGRVLSGLDGKNLANSHENLQFTNKSLNASMQDKDIPEYIEKHPELFSEVKEKMMNSDKKAKSIYERKLAKEYYRSPEFAKDVTFIAGSVGAKMGIRQALGFVFAEIWFAVKEEFNGVGEQFDFSELLSSIGNGIKRGFENAKEKYKELFAKFREGAIVGVLSNLTTTLCNIFFKTAKNVVKIIRQSYVSIVQAAKVLFLNPENLPFGERMRAIVKILAIGASVVVGSLVMESLGKIQIGTIPVVGEIIQTWNVNPF